MRTVHLQAATRKEGYAELLGESLGPGESDGLFFEREQQRIPVQYSYY
ncbi:hypothetical protein ANCCEY_02807 [Ancylostoma ceylanicum]|uniref:Uncharacterized protein n=1 Tax=Ancylostoma ceylanicum TaxID=53326 RepID=A0A0D6M1D0_9BILA|nr:hypothetical protein ANCCEY_02807 [Ancylostoma ceylanicum]